MKSVLINSLPKVLDEATMKIVHATAPVVAAHMDQITGVFYPHMLTKYPVVKV